jgi:hypothetical protein
VAALRGALERAGAAKIARGRVDVEALQRALVHLNPNAVLERGYAIVTTAEGNIVYDAATLNVGDDVEVAFARGTAGANIRRRKLGVQASAGSGSSTADVRRERAALAGLRSRRELRRRGDHVGVLRRWRSAWSISTSASIASAIGVARMPTHGSWRPCVLTTTGRPALSIERRSSRIDDVGFTAIVTTMSCPVEMPPGFRPRCSRGSLRRHLVRVLAACCSTLAKPAPISTPFHRVDAHHRLREIGVEAAVDGSPQPTGTPVALDGDLRAARIAGLAQRVHERLELGDDRRVGDEERIRVDVRPVLERDRDGTELHEMAADRHAVALASHLRAIAPAATRTAVSRAEARPPPR